jgi:ribonuclease HI
MTTTADLQIEQHFDQRVFKELAFNSKIGKKMAASQKSLFYNFIMIPIKDRDSRDEFVEANLRTKISSNLELTDQYLFSIYDAFKSGYVMIEKNKFSLDVFAIVDHSQFNIFYSDGSFKTATSEASYGVCELLEEDEEGFTDDLTGNKFKHKEFSDKIPRGTNNIGELSGLKKAISEFNTKDYQIIISDSEYSIKTFREWYFAWKDNGFRTYSNKPIANKELIQGIYKELAETKKVVIFKWVKAHNKSSFNERCDVLAKDALK